MNTPLYQTLLRHLNQKIYPFHMPGHKNKILPLDKLMSFDMTEIEGLDNLHAPKGVIEQALSRAAKLYQAEKTFYLVNGSTVGIMAAIMGLTNKRDQVLVARNCHKSVYHSILMHELRPRYIYPEVLSDYSVAGGINPEEIETALKCQTDIKLVIITSPTYEGVVSDIEEIAKITKKYQVPLLVDEAHGAHFNFCSQFPRSALALGADVVVHSLHKTLPSLTQTALLHIKNEELIKGHHIESYLKMLQTSSPSYILMASMDYCLGWLEVEGELYFDLLLKRIKDFRKKVKNLQPFQLLDEEIERQQHVYAIDLTKLLINVSRTPHTGISLEEILRNQYKIQVELANKDYILALSTLADSEEGLNQLYDALLEINKTFKSSGKNADIKNNIYLEAIFSPYEMHHQALECIPIEESVGAIAAEFIIPYPPGIPMVVPGERISSEVIATIRQHQEIGVELIGMEDQKLNYIKAVKRCNKE